MIVVGLAQTCEKKIMSILRMSISSIFLRSNIVLINIIVIIVLSRIKLLLVLRNC